jgi:hypothetical protein
MAIGSPADDLMRPAILYVAEVAASIKTVPA